MKPTDSGRFHDGVVHHRHDDGHGHDDFHNEDVAHEHSDINVRAILMSAVVIVVVTVATHFIILGTWRVLESDAAANDAEVSALTRPATQMPTTDTKSPYFVPETAAGPRLMTNEPAGLAEFRAKEQKQLQGYGWVDKNGGVTHLPIDAAKKLIAERGLPVAEGATAPRFTVRPQVRGEASGGRTVTVDLPDRTAAPGQAPAPAQKPHGGGH